MAPEHPDRSRPDIGLSLDAAGESELRRTIRYAFDFHLLRELNAVRTENQALRRMLSKSRRRPRTR